MSIIVSGILVLAAMRIEANPQSYWIACQRAYTMDKTVNNVDELLENEFDIPGARKRVWLPRLLGEVATGAHAIIQSFGFSSRIHVLFEMNKEITYSIEHSGAELGYYAASPCAREYGQALNGR